jgi:bacillithiol biosynthesis deacetylase BshB1
MPIDVLAVGSHPDDIEITCGGTVALLIKQGHSIVLADLTEGELSTRGTTVVRAQEAAEAARILGVSERRNLKLPDGNLSFTQENLRALITLIRELQPTILLIPHSVERHPDHVHTHTLCKEAWFYAGLKKIETTLNGAPQKAFRPQKYFEYMQWFEFAPSFIVDISDTFETKMASVRAYASQFHNPTSAEPETKLSKPEFLEMVETRARHYGQRIGVRYGEPFFSIAPVGVKSLFDLRFDKG